MKLHFGSKNGGGLAISAAAGRQFLSVRSARHGQIHLAAAEISLRAYQARPERLRERIAAEEPGTTEVPGSTTVVIDEVQKAPQLLDVVHSLVEERPELPTCRPSWPRS